MSREWEEINSEQENFAEAVLAVLAVLAVPPPQGVKMAINQMHGCVPVRGVATMQRTPPLDFDIGQTTLCVGIHHHHHRMRGTTNPANVEYRKCNESKSPPCSVVRSIADCKQSAILPRTGPPKPRSPPTIEMPSRVFERHFNPQVPRLPLKWSLDNTPAGKLVAFSSKSRWMFLSLMFRKPAAFKHQHIAWLNYFTSTFRASASRLVLSKGKSFIIRRSLSDKTDRGAQVSVDSQCVSFLSYVGVL